MKRVYSSDTVALAWHIRNLLEQYNIQAIVKNEQLYSVAGEVPLTECMPEVWVEDFAFSRAEKIIRDVENSTEPEGHDWICKNCKESNGASFGLCWNCQTSVSPDDG